MTEQDTAEQRLKGGLEFLKQHKNLVAYTILAIIIFMSVIIRAQSLPALVDATTGKPISLELDTTVFLRYAREIVENGELYKIDPLRYYPNGADLSDMGTMTSYLIAYWYFFLRIFKPDITLEAASNISPIIAMAIMTIFLFLLVRRIFNTKVALLSSLVISILPSFVYRSMGGSTDHDIYGMMFIMMSFYFLISAIQSSSMKKSITFGILAGFTTTLSRLTAGSASFIFFIFGIYMLWELFLNKYTKEDYAAFASWLLIPTIYFTFSHKFGGLSALLYSITTGICYLSFLILTIDFFLFKHRNYSWKHTIEAMMPTSIASTLLSTAVFFVLMLTMAGMEFFTNKLSQLNSLLFKFFAESRWQLTVAENRKTFLVDWFHQFNDIFVWIMIIGAILLFYTAVKNFHKAKHLTVAFAIFLCGYLFSRYKPGTALDGQSTLSRIFFVGGILIFLAYTIYYYFDLYKKDRQSFNKISTAKREYIFILTWFLLMAIASLSATRLFFEFSPIASIVFSFAIVWFVEKILTINNKFAKYVSLIIIIILLLNPTGYAQGILYNYYIQTKNEVKSVGPGYNLQWQYAGKWARENTPENAVFAHWWDYGYWVQEGFQRATLTDGGNAGGYALNYNMGRHVLTGHSDEEALQFLKAKNATHLLIISDEIGKYPAFSTIGSDTNYDRYSWINVFGLNTQDIQETRDYTKLLYAGSTALDDDIVYQGKVFPKSSSGIGGIFLYVKQDGNTTQFRPPEVAVIYNNQQTNIPLKCIFIDGKEIRFDVQDSINGCFILIPAIQNNQMSPLGAGLYLSPKVWPTLFTKLYLFNQQSPYFKLGYTDEKDVPLAIYNGRIIGPLKIWSISYPNNLTIPEYYYTNELPDQRVMLV